MCVYLCDDYLILGCHTRCLSDLEIPRLQALQCWTLLRLQLRLQPSYNPFGFCANTVIPIILIILAGCYQGGKYVA
jgi:hypothetical protein